MNTKPGFRQTLHEIIFEADTPAGKLFDVVLIISILLSVLAVMLDSVSSIGSVYGDLLYRIEWFFTVLFTIEYLLRLISVGKPFLSDERARIASNDICSPSFEWVH